MVPYEERLGGTSCMFFQSVPSANFEKLPKFQFLCKINGILQKKSMQWCTVIHLLSAGGIHQSSLSMTNAFSNGCTYSPNESMIAASKEMARKLMAVLQQSHQQYQKYHLYRQYCPPLDIDHPIAPPFKYRLYYRFQGITSRVFEEKI